MPELLRAVKKFGSRLRHPTSAWPQAKACGIYQRASRAREQWQRRSVGKDDVCRGRCEFICSNLDDNPSIKPRTRHYWRQTPCRPLKSWPGLNETEVRKITQAECKEWASAYAKLRRRQSTTTRFGILRHVFERRDRSRCYLRNPAASCETRRQSRERNRVAEQPRSSSADCVDARGPHGSRDCADFRGRLGVYRLPKRRSRQIHGATWNLTLAKSLCAATPKRAQKLGSAACATDSRCARTVSANAQRTNGRAARRESVPRGESQKALDRACKKVGADRITHHDLRHLFATRCIESGVDIPTVSRWLGHKDGGALAMKTYGHLRREHSIAQAQRVTFAPVTAKQADVIRFPATA